jgi:hypothetical protein
MVIFFNHCISFTVSWQLLCDEEVSEDENAAPQWCMYQYGTPLPPSSSLNHLHE